MTDFVIDPQPFPTIRTTAFDLPTWLGERQEQQPLNRLRFADGHVGWLVTNHAMASELLAD